MARRYRMKKRAATQDETRERIVRATIALHDEQGVATTTFADVAARAGVGPATVLRHFPAVGDLVKACGRHVAAEMRPPSPADAGAIFAGVETTRGRLKRLAEELDAFYARGELRLTAATNDRHRVPELDGFLEMVDSGIEALIREALAKEQSDERQVGVLMGLCDLAVWRHIRDAVPGKAERRSLLADVLESALAVLRTRTEEREE